MTRSFTCSAWMLPVLLLFVFIPLHQTSIVTKCKLDAFNIDVDHLGHSVANCPEDCNSVPNTNTKCKCLNINMSHANTTCNHHNINMSHAECALLDYVTEGLTSLRHRIPTESAIQYLINRLPWMVQLCEFGESGQDATEKIKVCELNVEYEPVISPGNFHKKLRDLTQKLNNNCSAKTQ